MPNDGNVELWTLYAFGVSFTILRTYARISAVGISELSVDDYLIWFAMLIYTTQCTLGYHVGTLAHGLANNGMSDEQRSTLSQDIDNPEYAMRVLGSKIQLAGWTCAACILWTLKMCMAFFYLRLTNGLKQYHIRIYAVIGLIIVTFVISILTILLSCRPFHHYWQINPDPGNKCQAAVSKPIIWVTFVTNVATDICLLMIPLPMLWKSSLRTIKKVASSIVLSAGVFIIVCAALKSIYVIVDPINGGQLAAEWGTRETFVAVVTTNLPMIFPLLKNLLAPYLASTLRSSSNNKKSYKTPSGGFVTIGGGGGASSRNRQGGQHSAHHITANLTFDNESEENIVKEGDGDVKMGPIGVGKSGAEVGVGNVGAVRPGFGGIVVEQEVSVTAEDYHHGHRSPEPFHRV